MEKLKYEQVENFQIRSSIAASGSPGKIKRLDVLATNTGVYYEVVVNEITQFQGTTLFQAVQEYNRLA